MAEPPDIRIGTAEREEAVTLLGEHFSAGRLTVDEFDERVGLANLARTRGDLVPLFADLPTAPASVARRTGRDTATDLVTLVPFALAALLLLVVLRNPIGVLIAVAILVFVVRRGYRLLGPGSG
ncbi:MAG: DUF1707 domain-containing protein [Rhodococcus sp.]|uniref:DUF1707 SHOCT-like domain-containing protein n=1 Tax=Rhodococcus TaxID=1827 RepID=UPI0016A2B86E|nr:MULTISPECIES: DUF1707 domain-containing protein [Rhodococcus]NLV80895.1 DUF1707 domain-containing protein [Rhodococcus sp. (in: high G+C Gram-positive bacteria)]